MLTKIAGDLLPFLLDAEAASRYGATSAMIPIRGIGQISFLAMEVSVDPCSIRIRDLLTEIVSAIPVTDFCMPKGELWQAQSYWRRATMADGGEKFLSINHRGKWQDVLADVSEWHRAFAGRQH